MTCPKKYSLQYNERVYPESTPIHLILGSAFDKAGNALLEGIGDPFTCANAELARIFFDKVDYAHKDVELNILCPVSREAMIKELQSIGWKGEDPQELCNALFSKLYDGETLSEGQRNALNTLVYYTCIEKISMMIEGFKNHILPKIEKVVSVQTNHKRGISDALVVFKDMPGVVVLDNKTASKPYKNDSVLYSVQLAGYEAMIGAYCVFHKAVKPGAREIVPQLIIHEVPEHNRTMVEEAYQNTETLIEAGVFPRNLNACGKSFGKPCVYVDLCWKNSMKGLVKKNEKI
jgi:hypothetical protein